MINARKSCLRLSGRLSRSEALGILNIFRRTLKIAEPRVIQINTSVVGRRRHHGRIWKSYVMLCPYQLEVRLEYCFDFTESNNLSQTYPTTSPSIRVEPKWRWTTSNWPDGEEPKDLRGPWFLTQQPVGEKRLRTNSWRLDGIWWDTMA